MPKEPVRTRIDDPSAAIDNLIAHACLALAVAVAALSFFVPAMRGARIGALVVSIASAGRLVFHPLRLVSLSRVYVEGGRVLVAPLLGTPREVEVVALEHDTHAPWPCALSLSDGNKIPFVARRDDGGLAFFDLELSDRKRYERPRDARDSLTEVERIVRISNAPSRAA